MRKKGCLNFLYVSSSRKGSSRKGIDNSPGPAILLGSGKRVV